jgi:hypothetical protein
MPRIPRLGRGEEDVPPGAPETEQAQTEQPKQELISGDPLATPAPPSAAPSAPSPHALTSGDPLAGPGAPPAPAAPAREAGGIPDVPAAPTPATPAEEVTDVSAAPAPPTPAEEVTDAPAPPAPPAPAEGVADASAAPAPPVPAEGVADVSAGPAVGGADEAGAPPAAAEAAPAVPEAGEGVAPSGGVEDSAPAAPAAPLDSPTIVAGPSEWAAEPGAERAVEQVEQASVTPPPPSPPSEASSPSPPAPDAGAAAAPDVAASWGAAPATTTSSRPSRRKWPFKRGKKESGSEEPARADAPADTSLWSAPAGEQPTTALPAPDAAGAAALPPATTSTFVAAPAGPGEQPQTVVEQAPVDAKPSFRERTRMRRRMRELRRLREISFRDLGGLTFDLHRFGRERPDLVTQKLESLREIDSQLRTIETALDARRPLIELREPGVAACPRCGTVHGTDANFCPGCGTPLRGSVVSDAAPLRVTPVDQPQTQTPAPPQTPATPS